MVMVSLPTHPFESVTKTVYIPAGNPVAVAALPPEGDQLYVYGEVPPLTVTVAEPSFPPLHRTLLEKFIEAVGPVPLTLIICEVESMLPVQLVTTSHTVYVPLLLKVWEGFASEEVSLFPEPGSPKFQAKDFISLQPGVLLFVKLTVTGVHPPGVLAVKDAVGLSGT